jgi:hypothetical protein
LTIVAVYTIKDEIEPIFELAFCFPLLSIHLLVEFNKGVFTHRQMPLVSISDQFEDSILHTDDSDLLTGNSYTIKIFQVVIDTLKGLLDCTCAFIVHANADEYFDVSDSESWLLGNLFEIVNHSVLWLEGFEILTVWCGTIVVDACVGCYRFCITG